MYYKIFIRSVCPCPVPSMPGKEGRKLVCICPLPSLTVRSPQKATQSRAAPWFSTGSIKDETKKLATLQQQHFSWWRIHTTSPILLPTAVILSFTQQLLPCRKCHFIWSCLVCKCWLLNRALLVWNNVFSIYLKYITNIMVANSRRLN